MYKAKFLAFEKYVPQTVITNDMLSKLVDTNDEWISSRTGIKERHISTGENTSQLCVSVLNGLLKKSGLSPLDIDVIIVATTTPDYLTPTTSCIVQSETGAKNAFCFDVGAGCSGFIFGLSIAEKYIACGYKNIAVIGADIISKITDWSDRSVCVIFADGAGGALLTRAESGGILAEDIHTDGEKVDSIVGHHIPVNNAFTDKKESGQEFVRMDGRSVFDFVIREIPKSINALLSKSGLTLNNIDYIVPHQANARIVEAVAKKLKIGMDKFFINIQKYGNTSAASIGIALAEMEEDGLIRPNSGQRLILTGFGSGMTWGSILIEL